MGLTRREFLKVSGVAAAGTTVGGLWEPKTVGWHGADEPFRIKYAHETTSICPYCAVGCGLIVHNSAGKVVNVEGDPDHPINEGSLCSKGSALYQVANNERRLKTVKYRAPGSSIWEEKSWEWALEQIANRIKRSRDATFKDKVKDTDGNEQIVNRTEGIGCLGGAALDNEECYLISKFARSLGIVYLEHQARL